MWVDADEKGEPAGPREAGEIGRGAWVWFSISLPFFLLSAFFGLFAFGLHLVGGGGGGGSSGGWSHG